jgi:hypothetical protein
LLFLFLVAFGCSGKKTVKVEGVVKIDGVATPGVVVKFVNQDKSGRDADGYTDPNGVFKLSTFNTNDGAMPGSYKVTLSMSTSSEMVEGPPVDSKRPPSMAKAMQNFAQNQPRGSGPAKSPLPDAYLKADSTPLKYQIPYDGRIEIEISSKTSK